MYSNRPESCLERDRFDVYVNTPVHLLILRCSVCLCGVFQSVPTVSVIKCDLIILFSDFYAFYLYHNKILCDYKITRYERHIMPIPTDILYLYTYILT